MLLVWPENFLREETIEELEKCCWRKVQKMWLWEAVLTTKKSYWVVPEFYCSEVMVHFLTLCSCVWLHAPVKDQEFGCLLPEVCLHSAVSVLQENMFK